MVKAVHARCAELAEIRAGGAGAQNLGHVWAASKRRAWLLVDSRLLLPAQSSTAPLLCAVTRLTDPTGARRGLWCAHTRFRPRWGNAQVRLFGTPRRPIQSSEPAGSVAPRDKLQSRANCWEIAIPPA